MNEHYHNADDGDASDETHEGEPLPTPDSGPGGSGVAEGDEADTSHDISDGALATEAREEVDEIGEASEPVDESSELVDEASEPVDESSELVDEAVESPDDSPADVLALPDADLSTVGEPAESVDSGSEEETRFIAETGRTIEWPFLSFFEHFGSTLCGLPISDVVVEGGVRTQYFQCVALEEHLPGRVRVKHLGEDYLSLLARQLDPTEVVAPSMIDLRQGLRRDPTQHYATRPISDIRYLVVHHTGAAADIGPTEIAAEHVEGNGWPGIGYHFVVDGGGTIYQSQDLTTVSYHARQFNQVAVGIALIGDLSSALPTASQLDATAHLVAGLLSDLGLPPDAVRGHREMVPTPCPGESFLRVWKPGLMQAVASRLESGRSPDGESADGPWPTGLND